jgi:hypothetical protein
MIHTTLFSTTLLRHILFLEQLEEVVESVESSRIVCVRSDKYIVLHLFHFISSAIY